MKKHVFDSLCAQRVLLEMLFEAGLAQEALRVSRELDEAQLDAWQEEQARPRQIARV